MERIRREGVLPPASIPCHRIGKEPGEMAVKISVGAIPPVELIALQRHVDGDMGQRRVLLFSYGTVQCAWSLNAGVQRYGVVFSLSLCLFWQAGLYKYKRFH